jgi:uncharacterized protein (TIGR02271 family)
MSPMTPDPLPLPAPSTPQAGPDTVEPIARVPLVEETLEVGRRVITTGGVRVLRSIDTRKVTVDEPLRRETVRVERVPVERLLEGTEPPAPRQEGDTLVIPVVEEVLVVERRLFLREELRVHRTSETFHAPQEHVLRSERMSVIRTDAEGRPIADAPQAPDDDAVRAAPPPPDLPRGDTR